MIEELSKNITLSFFASQAYRSQDPARTTAMITTTAMIYQYTQAPLLMSYGVALLATLASLLVGLLAYRKNGGERGLAYSAIVHAARDSGIDRSAESSAIASPSCETPMEVEKGLKCPVVVERKFSTP